MYPNPLGLKFQESPLKGENWIRKIWKDVIIVEGLRVNLKNVSKSTFRQPWTHFFVNKVLRHEIARGLIPSLIKLRFKSWRKKFTRNFFLVF